MSYGFLSEQKTSHRKQTTEQGEKIDAAISGR
jgi:hypothetical protein